MINKSQLYSEYGAVNCIKQELKSSCDNAVAIGFYLDEIKRLDSWKSADTYQSFKVGSYKTSSGIIKYTTYTFYTFCSLELGLSRRSVDRFINIFKAFAALNSSGVRTKFVDDKYKDYNTSQLAEILGLSDKARKIVNPGMSVKEIRSIKNKLIDDTEEDEEGTFVNKEDEEESVAEEPVAGYDVDMTNDNILFTDKKFKKKTYHASNVLYDKFVSSPSQYSQQFIKLQEYLNKGYLVRLVLYAPEDEEVKDVI